MLGSIETFDGISIVHKIIGFVKSWIHLDHFEWLVCFISMHSFFSNISLESLLTCHRASVVSEDRLRITVRRKHIFEDTLHKLRCGIDISKHLRVTFIGEPAIDDGGPMREYLRLLLDAVMCNHSLFSGAVNSRHLRHNVIELSKKTYFHVGQILSMSLMDHYLPFSLNRLLTTFCMD